MKVAVIGGGIVGLCSAYYLNKQGVDVTVFDKEKSNHRGCSYGNAGFIVPSHMIPLSSPGMVAKGLKWMLKSSSPFYIKPSLDPFVWKWVRQFMKNSTLEHVNENSGFLRDLNFQSQGLLKEIIQENKLEVYQKSKGLMMLYSSHKGEKSELEDAHYLENNGIEIEHFTKNNLSDVLGVESNAKGGYLMKTDMNIDPDQLMENLKSTLLNKGVKFKWENKVDKLLQENSQITGLSSNNIDYSFDRMLISSGSYTNRLLESIQVKIPLLAGKGYSLETTHTSFSLQLPCLFSEAKVAVNPLNNKIRFAGTLEINKTDLSINENRVEGIVNSIPSYFPGFDVSELNRKKVWAGLRPCSPDGIPYMGKVDNFNNLYVSCGHAMLGLSLGAVSGKLLSDHICKDEQLDERFRVMRFQK